MFAATDGPVLSGQYRLMIRAEREKAAERKKNDETEIRPYTDEEIEAIDEAIAGERGAPPGRRAAVVGGRRGGRRAVARW